MFVAILNFDKDFQSREIQRSIPNSIVIDSSGKNKQGFIKTDKPFATGCMNKAIELFFKSKEDSILFICSDVIGDWRSIVYTCENLNKNIGSYTPSVYGQGWKHEKPLIGSSYFTDIPFAEGMICYYNRKIIETVRFFDYSKNKHGYGGDIYYGYICRKLGLLCVRDNNICVYHPFGTGYSQKEGEKQMKIWCKEKGNDFYNFCKSLNLFQPFYIRIPRKIKDKLKEKLGF